MKILPGKIPLAVALMLMAGPAFAEQSFQPGEVWKDVAGAPIQAHGGGILVRSNIYYWYGEDRTPGGRGSVSCYSSTNLYDWKREGTALARQDLPRTNNAPTFVERPKVIYNEHTRKYVMWTHLEQNGYRLSCAGIATSDMPAGPFAMVRAIRPVTDGSYMKKETGAREQELGGVYRDMNLFVDDDGKAYTFYASEDNWTLYVVRLNEDYTAPETPVVENKTWARILKTQREAPAPFKYQGKYYLITSGCTGWTPNAADYAIADNVLGPYAKQGNPCVGEQSEITYGTQSTYVLPAPGHPGSFIFMADEWRPRQLPDSRYVWLPFTLKPDGAFKIEWKDKWDLSVFNGK